MEVRSTNSAFDEFLAQRGVRFEGIVIGGAALNLQGIVQRPTKDCDVLEPSVPADVAAAARAFAELQRKQGNARDDHWFNDGPGSLAEVLPVGWRSKVASIFEGRSLRLFTLGREDMLRSKLFALCDRGIDLPDCLALAPTHAELDAVRPWLELQDANPDWPEHVQRNLRFVGRKLGHGP